MSRQRHRTRLDRHAALPRVAGDDARPERFLEMLQRTIPLRRLGTADDVARVALFLASDASAYTSGAVIPVRRRTGGVPMNDDRPRSRLSPAAGRAWARRSSVGSPPSDYHVVVADIDEPRAQQVSDNLVGRGPARATP